MSDAVWAIIGVVVGALSSGVINVVLQGRQFNHEKEMFRIQHQGAENVKAFLTEMLSHNTYTDRSFEALRNRVGGYSDSEIRQLLHEINAKKTRRNSDGKELWYLASRESERIEKREAQAG